MAVKQDIDVGLVAFTGLIGAMLLLIGIWGVEAWYAYEVDLLTHERHQEDRNVAWAQLRDEQYANIGDPVGNQTVYAVAETGEEALGGSQGYRFTSRERDIAVIPIHAAMAHIVRQHGQQEVTIEQMRAADREVAKISNPAYDQYMTPRAAEARPQQGTPVEQQGQQQPPPQPPAEPGGQGGG